MTVLPGDIPRSDYYDFIVERVGKNERGQPVLRVTIETECEWYGKQVSTKVTRKLLNQLKRIHPHLRTVYDLQRGDRFRGKLTVSTYSRIGPNFIQADEPDPNFKFYAFYAIEGAVRSNIDGATGVQSVLLGRERFRRS